MKPEEAIRAEDVRRAAELARAHARAPALGAFAFDVLCRQAEGRVLLSGKELVRARAQEHGVEVQDAETELGNLRTVLERGTETAAERALVAAFALRGLGERLRAAPTEGVVEAFLVHADWLELATPFCVYALVDPVLDAEDAARVWDGVVRAVLAEPGKAAGPHFDGPGRNAMRLSALAASSSEAAREGLARVAREANEPPTRALARHLTGGRVDEDAQVRVSGVLGPRPSGPVVAALRVVTGLAALSWLLRLVFSLVGMRREAELALVPGGLRVRRRDVLLGRSVRERDETFTFAALASAGRLVLFPRLHLLVGLLSTSIGVLLGGFLLFHGARTGETVLLLLAAALVVAGAGLDLALDVLVPARRRRVRIELALLPRRSLAIAGVSIEEADRFLEALREHARG